MAPSSSGSWTGADADIIDLDRYMRGGVRPPRTLDEYEQLVVDRGGGGGGGGAARKAEESARYKLYSNDSGVSDGSYVQRRVHRPRKRGSNAEGCGRGGSVPGAGSVARSSGSLRAFRAACEQALRDQQLQIARVAQLCERLTERADNERTDVKAIIEKPPTPNKASKRSSLSETGRVTEKAKRASERPRQASLKAERVQSDTSDITSSSRSSKDLRHKEKLRTQECKTYKIIMTKLDELNRRFATPRPAAAPLLVPAPAPRTRPRPRTPSSTSVSVCDKLVATDLETRHTSFIRPAVQSSFGRNVLRAPTPRPPQTPPPPHSPRAPHSPRSPHAHVVTQVYNVDIAPRDCAKASNVATENVVKRQSSGASGSSAAGAGDPRSHFDLEDPVHLYSQAKRLQTLNATVPLRARSSGARGAGGAGAAGGAGIERRERARSPSLCSACRGYWRSLRQCLFATFAQDSKYS